MLLKSCNYQAARDTAFTIPPLDYSDLYATFETTNFIWHPTKRPAAPQLSIMIMCPVLLGKVIRDPETYHLRVTRILPEM